MNHASNIPVRFGRGVPGAFGRSQAIRAAVVVVAFLLAGCGPEAVSPQAGESPPSAGVLAEMRGKAEAGDAAAQAALARLHMKGAGVTNSYAEAARLFELAAAQGHPDAQAGLGELYEAGQGVSKDLSKALEWYQRAASNGSAAAQYNLGFIYESGRGVPQDHALAARYFLQAANQGEPLSQYDLGQRYLLGVGVPVDKVEGLKWLLLAARQGQADAVKKANEVRSALTKQEVAEAQRRVAEFDGRRN